MKAFIFPGQGSQFQGMGAQLIAQFPESKQWLDQADDLLGYKLSEVMIEGSEAALKETKVTQPAIFVYSHIIKELLGEAFKPDMVAGHSLGELSALVAAEVVSFEDGLHLVSQRANAMQVACEANPSSMAAILGLDNDAVTSVCASISEGLVVVANFNSPGQVVISGTTEAVTNACEQLSAAGAKRTVMLPVGGAFHSPLMEQARTSFAQAVDQLTFSTPVCPVYQNIVAQPITDPKIIKENLVNQLISPVKWTQSIQQMITDGADTFVEVGPGNVLQGLNKKIDRAISVSSAEKDLTTS